MKGEVLQKVPGEGRKGNLIELCRKSKRARTFLFILKSMISKSIKIMITRLIGKIYRTAQKGEELKKPQKKGEKGYQLNGVETH